MSTSFRPWRSTARDEFHFWQPRFHDFNVYTPHKFKEKLNYIHNNPVRRGLVTQPGDWPWSSYRLEMSALRQQDDDDSTTGTRRSAPTFSTMVVEHGQM